MRNLRSKRKVSDQQNIEAIIDGFETNTNSISNVDDNSSKSPTPKTTRDTTLSDNDLYPFALKVTSITTSANDDIFINSLLKSSPNELETQVPIIIENENSDSSHLPSIDIENPNKIFTSDTTNQSSNGIESQMKNLFDFCKQIMCHRRKEKIRVVGAICGRWSQRNNK
ncbi:unnamed protein product [Rhizophagus irregularis]|nr:unnamed protein product [Rhizophagus irregularis]CAB4402342.1 unnamed protein product [Rhizophagus irregularis]CAB4406920.1 unnamed protein product [Rhizophagus irregularis]CAB4407067.1 unnamed protein product [Rhizophagus irregularis]CAB4414765.1 unnamed protein product [Rhizophagus irregularis]